MLLLVTIYRTRVCPFCVLAARLFDRKRIVYEEIYLDGKDDERAELMNRTNWRTVPQIFIGDQFVGGFQEVAQLDQQGKLDAMITGEEL